MINNKNTFRTVINRLNLVKIEDNKVESNVNENVAFFDTDIYDNSYHEFKDINTIHKKNGVMIVVLSNDKLLKEIGCNIDYYNKLDVTDIYLRINNFDYKSTFNDYEKWNISLELYSNGNLLTDSDVINDIIDNYYRAYIWEFISECGY